MRGEHLTLAILLAGFWGSGCGDAGGAPGDQGPEAPRIPWLAQGVPPIEWPCPAGWREGADEGGVTVCDPYPDGGAQECVEGEAHFPGEPGCRSIGRDCGEGPFADASDLDPATVRFVDRSAAPGGDGSRAAAFPTLAAAFDAARPGETLLLASGTYEVDRSWPSGVSVRGRCAAGTSLVQARSGTLLGAVVVATRPRESFALDGVTIGPASGAGVSLLGDGITLTLRGVLIESVDALGLSVRGAASTVATDLVVREVRSAPDGNFGVGVFASRRASLALERALVVGARMSGIIASDPGTTATLTGVAVADTRGRRDGLAGDGLVVAEGAAMTVGRGLVSRSHGHGVSAWGAGSRATLRDLVVEGALVGVDAYAGATVDLHRGRVEGAQLGVATADGSQAMLRDLHVRDTRGGGGPDDVFGRGIQVERGTMVTLERGLIERARGVGVFLGGAGATLALDDVAIRDTGSNADGTGGRGINVQQGAALTLSHGLVESNREIGVFVGDAVATLNDLVVRDTRGQSDGTRGRGIDINRSANLTLERGLIARSVEVGLLASTQATVDARDLVVESTRPPECGSSCPGPHYPGVNIGSTVEADIALDGFRLVGGDGTLCGFYLGAGGRLRPDMGQVVGHDVGACVDSAGSLDPLLGRGVEYVDNGIDVQARDFELPAPSLLVPF